ncbi:tRNA1(Val) A37 N6-methylase TrmN6 [Alteribacillus persepolensis]|uniref:tRNA1(Val) A37 N6-methylase TrmN6 n=1 Tax=Alteribacillus persepolensis TaxID=568899 RepID=A0A1G8HY05_9BACI|nr:tRNA1(Val) (adenine(37)-N6)-methyltransferase [Alteribacillus persepolensis]SDI11442.1 tRNA1(Val) A37 N6-methylase TrmN6 [Alteribacillus persepolensis]
MLQQGERLDYITDGLYIIQSKEVFAFSIDAVLLARFTYVPRTRGTIVDLCSGNGIIPLVLSTRSRVPITGIEIQSRLVGMAQRSAAYNHLDHQISFVEKDVRNSHLLDGQADLITCNPPYFDTPGEKEKNKNPHLTAARHEENGSLEEIIASAAKLVKQKGKVSMVLRPERFPELMEAYRKHRLEPKRVKWIYPKKGKEANVVLLEGIKDGKPGLACLPPLTVYDEHGKYTEEFRKYYEGQ